jgi:raffinose/stachyose/melibiose transport system substrate-binding protein
MTTPTHISRRSVLRGTAGIGAGVGAATLLAACGDDDKKSSDSSNANEPITGSFDWWNIGITDPGKTINAQYVSDFEAAHAGVKVNNVIQENEAFKAKLLTVTQAGNAPALFHSWGGGVLKQQTEAGLTKEITDKQFLSTMNKNGNELYKVDGKQYGVAFDLGMVGFWYNKDLFAKAGVNSPPKTWNEFIDAVKRLKAAGVVPLALAGAEKWPGHFYWSYLVIRQVGDAGLQAAVKNAA